MKKFVNLYSPLKIIYLCVFLMAFSAVGQAASQFQEIPSSGQLEKFTANVLTKGYYQNGKTFHKWNKLVTISLFGKAFLLRPTAERVCGEMNQLLKGLPVTFKVVEDNLPTADIWYVILPEAEMIKMQNEEGFFPKTYAYPVTQKLAFDSSFTSYRFYQKEPVRGKATYEDVETFFHGTFLTALGFALNHWQPPFGGLKSIWFDLPKEGIAGMDTHAHTLSWLSDFDRKIIRFAYEMVPQNANDSIIKPLVRKRWKEVKLPAVD